jgi:Protein of unknown function (DUF3313)
MQHRQSPDWRGWVDGKSLGRWAITCAAILVAGLGSAPAALAKNKKPPEISAFLGDASDLTPLPGNEDLLVYRKRPGALAGYERFLIPTPLLYLDPSTVGKGVDPEELAMLADYLRDALVAALEEEPTNYQVVDESGPGILIVRSAITGVVPVDPKKNLGATAVGIALGVGLLVPRVDLGEASIEVEMLDGESGERLVAVAAAKGGRRFFGKIKGAKRWGDVKAAFKSWAKLFRRALDRVNEMEQ